MTVLFLFTLESLFLAAISYITSPLDQRRRKADAAAGTNTSHISRDSAGVAGTQPICKPDSGLQIAIWCNSDHVP